MNPRASLVCAAVLAALASSSRAESPTLRGAQRAFLAGDATRAATMFETLAQRGESLEAEIGLIRASLQSGEFRKAMAYANLTSGEHPDSGEALAILALLHDRVGRTEQALSLLDKARATRPDDPALVGAYAQILTDRLATTRAQELLKSWSTAERRHALAAAWPAPPFERLEIGAHRIEHAGNGIVVDRGTHVLTQVSLVPRGDAIVLVRNGLGQVRRATVIPADPASELVRLKLDAPFPSHWSADEAAAPEDTRFCFVLGFATPASDRATYPAMTPGVVFRRTAGDSNAVRITSTLGPDHTGAAIFDPRGRLIAIARAPSGSGHLAVRVTPSREIPSATPQPMPAIEELYERLAPAAVQIVALRAIE